MDLLTRITFLCLTLGLLLNSGNAEAALPSWCDITLSPSTGDRTAAIQRLLS